MGSFKVWLVEDQLGRSFAALRMTGARVSVILSAAKDLPSWI